MRPAAADRILDIGATYRAAVDSLCASSLVSPTARGTRYHVWSHEENLNYISARELRALWPADGLPLVTYSGVGFASWKSNLIIYRS